MFKFVSIVVLALLSGTVIAQPVQQSFVNKDGEYLLIESRESNSAFPAVVAAIEKAGYRPNTSGNIEPGTKTDTWCKVNVYQERQILGECYTPQAGRSLSVRNHLTWTKDEFKGDYSAVPAMITKIRAEHRRASQALNPPILIVPTF